MGQSQHSLKPLNTVVNIKITNNNVQKFISTYDGIHFHKNFMQQLDLDISINKIIFSCATSPFSFTFTYLDITLLYTVTMQRIPE